MKRYVLTVDLYVYADDDDEAKVIGQNVVDNFNNSEDCKASVVAIHEVPFGAIGEAREVK